MRLESGAGALDRIRPSLPADRANEPLNVSVLPGPLGAPPSSQPAGPACFGSRVIAVRLARRFVEIPDFIGAPGEIRTPDPQIRSLVSLRNRSCQQGPEIYYGLAIERLADTCKAEGKDHSMIGWPGNQQ